MDGLGPGGELDEAAAFALFQQVMYMYHVYVKLNLRKVL